MIMKALVELDGPRSQPFQAFAEQREKWMVHDMYRAPGKLPLLMLPSDAMLLQSEPPILLLLLLPSDARRSGQQHYCSWFGSVADVSVKT